MKKHRPRLQLFSIMKKTRELKKETKRDLESAKKG